MKLKMIGGAPYSGGVRADIVCQLTMERQYFEATWLLRVTGGGIEVHADGGTVPIVVGCQFDPTTKEQVFGNHYPASTNAGDIIAFVIDDPMVVFEIQCNSSVPVADLFGNFDIVYTTAGSTVTGISGAELNVSDGATGTSLAVKVIDISEDPENSDVLLIRPMSIV